MIIDPKFLTDKKDDSKKYEKMKNKGVIFFILLNIKYFVTATKITISY